MTEQKEWNSRYLAYCKAHGEQDPEVMLQKDRVRWPGGYMAGYIIWNSNMLRKFLEYNPQYKLGDSLTKEGLQEYDRQLLDPANLRTLSQLKPEWKDLPAKYGETA